MSFITGSDIGFPVSPEAADACNFVFETAGADDRVGIRVSLERLRYISPKGRDISSDGHFVESSHFPESEIHILC